MNGNYSNYSKFALNQSTNKWILDPVQYQIGHINFNNGQNFAEGNRVSENEPFEHTMIPEYTKVRKSTNDFRSQSYRRFEANNGNFNPNEATDNTDLWYYGGDLGGGKAHNLQEYQHIILPEVQRGGLNTTNMVKYSWNDSDKCKIFNYNVKNNEVPGPGLGDSVNNIYSFDSGYTRSIGIQNQREGSMPYSVTQDNVVGTDF